MKEPKEGWEALKETARIVSANALLILIFSAIYRWTAKQVRRLATALERVLYWLAGVE